MCGRSQLYKLKNVNTDDSSMKIFSKYFHLKHLEHLRTLTYLGKLNRYRFLAESIYMLLNGHFHSKFLFVLQFFDI